jgi:hypothetical protein
MTTYSVRCCNSKCRHRRVTGTHPDDYKVVPACPRCGERRGWRIEGRAYNQRNLCRCSGPAACKGQQFPHQTTHPLCDENPLGPYNQLKARGVSDDEMPLQAIPARPCTTEDAPF